MIHVNLKQNLQASYSLQNTTKYIHLAHYRNEFAGQADWTCETGIL